MVKAPEFTGEVFLRPLQSSIAGLDYCSQSLPEIRTYLVEHLMNRAIKPDLAPLVIRLMVSRTDHLPMLPIGFVINLHLRRRCLEWCEKRGLSPKIYFSSAIDAVYGSLDLSSEPATDFQSLFDLDRVAYAVQQFVSMGSRCKPT